MAARDVRSRGVRRRRLLCVWGGGGSILYRGIHYALRRSPHPKIHSLRTAQVSPSKDPGFSGRNFLFSGNTPNTVRHASTRVEHGCSAPAATVCSCARGTMLRYVMLCSFLRSDPTFCDRSRLRVRVYATMFCSVLFCHVLFCLLCPRVCDALTPLRLPVARFRFVFGA